MLAFCSHNAEWVSGSDLVHGSDNVEAEGSEERNIQLCISCILPERKASLTGTSSQQTDSIKFSQLRILVQP